MTANVIHQFLHGYRKGHQLLNGSCRLPVAASDLIDQLSDLPGSLPSGFQFDSLLTVYPVQVSGFHAVARTWPDNTAPRAGCVFTHTILVPSSQWETTKDPAYFAAYCDRPPASDDFSQYKLPLELPAKPVSATPRALPVGSDAYHEFVRKFFGEGIRPLVFIDCGEPEGLIWSILRLAWPTLRSRFTACSLCFQPRAIGDRRFDLMFAPAAARPRFHSIPREAIVPSPGAGTERSEPWLSELGAALMTSDPRFSIQTEEADLGAYLSDDPAAVRSLFIARELRRRLPDSPSAGAGLLDLIESLAPTAGTAGTLKATAVAAALTAATAAPTVDALRCLYMLSERLDRTAFHEHSVAVSTQISKAVSRFAALDAAAAVATPGVSGRKVPPIKPGPFAEGLLDGLEYVSRRNPSIIKVLADSPELGAFVVTNRPQIATAYLASTRNENSEAVTLLTRWVTAADPSARMRLREHILPVVTPGDVTLLTELLRDLPVEEVDVSLDRLVRSGSLGERQVRRVLSEAIAIRHPAAFIHWAETTTEWPSEMAEVAVDAYDTTQAGLESILATQFRDSLRRAQIIAVFLEGVMDSGRGGWLHDYAVDSAAFLIPLIVERAALTSTHPGIIGRVLAACPNVAITREQTLLPLIGNLQGTPEFGEVVRRAVASAVSEAIRGRIEQDECERWLSAQWANDWFDRSTHQQLTDLFALLLSGQNRSRAWQVLARLPDTVFCGSHASAICDLTRSLVEDGDGVAETENAAAWKKILKRAVILSPYDVRIRLAVDALVVSFQHTKLPLGGAVASAFRTVYDAVANSSSSPEETSILFGFFDWDKAKELRKTLITSFLDSRWRPGDLAVAVGDEQLLRKIVKRLCRKRRGDSYLNAMVEDLYNRDDPEAIAVRELVRELAANTDYYEPWD